jgi:hypothetical protein
MDITISEWHRNSLAYKTDNNLNEIAGKAFVRAQIYQSRSKKLTRH